MDRKCEVCGKNVGPEGKINHWRKYHPKYFKIYTRLWILSGALIVGGAVLLRIIEAASPGSEASSLADWIGYPVLGIGSVLLFIATRLYLGRVRKSLMDSDEGHFGNRSNMSGYPVDLFRLSSPDSAFTSVLSKRLLRREKPAVIIFLIAWWGD